MALVVACAGVSSVMGGLTSFGDAILVHICLSGLGAAGLLSDRTSDLRFAVLVTGLMSLVALPCALFFARASLRASLPYGLVMATTGCVFVLVGARVLFMGDLTVVKAAAGCVFLLFSAWRLLAGAVDDARAAVLAEGPSGGGGSGRSGSGCGSGLKHGRADGSAEPSVTALEAALDELWGPLPVGEGGGRAGESGVAGGSAPAAAASVLQPSATTGAAEQPPASPPPLLLRLLAAAQSAEGADGGVEASVYPIAADAPLTVVAYGVQPATPPNAAGSPQPATPMSPLPGGEADALPLLRGGDRAQLREGARKPSPPLSVPSGTLSRVRAWVDARVPPIAPAWSSSGALLLLLFTGVGSGFLGGLLGTAGPPIMVAFSLLALHMDRVRGVSTVYACVDLPVRVLAWTTASESVFDASDAGFYVAISAAALAGYIFGTWLRRCVDSTFVLRVLLVLVALSSAILLGALENAAIAAAFAAGALALGAVLVAMRLNPRIVKEGVCARSSSDSE